MSVIYSKGIGLGTVSGAAYMDLSVDKQATATVVTPPEVTSMDNVPWCKWGDDNLQPQGYIKDIESCGVLGSGIDGKARFAIGKGIMPVKITGYNKDGSEIQEPVSKNYEIEDFLEASNIYFQSFAWFKDQIGLNKLDARYVTTRDRKKISYIQREDPCTVRVGKAETAGKNMGKITKAYLSYQWESAVNYDKAAGKVIEFPLLPTVNTIEYFKQLLASGKDTNFFYSTFYPSWNKRYYPKPLWTAAYDWVKIAQGVPKMKAAMFQNNIRLKYMVIIDESYWKRNFSSWNDPSIYTDAKKEEARQELFDEIEKYLTGAENAYKTIFVNGGFNPATKSEWQDIKVVPITDSTKNGELLPDSAAANSEILFAIMMNPALMGVGEPGSGMGAGSGSNIREAGLIQVMIQEFERRQVSEIMRIAQRINNWDRDIVWRFPGLVLTTLDTGGSMKQVA